MMKKNVSIFLGLGLLVSTALVCVQPAGALPSASPALIPKTAPVLIPAPDQKMEKKSSIGDLDSIPVRYTIGNVPMIEQARNECGPTVLLMMMNYYGVPVNISALKSPLKWHPENGVSYQSMIGFPYKQYGIQIDYAGEGDWARLLFEVSRNRPVIVRQWANLTEKKLRQTGHYRIVVGYDRENGKVYVHDPLFKTIVLDQAEFLSLWDMKGHVNPTRNYMICLKKETDGLSAKSAE